MVLDGSSSYDLNDATLPLQYHWSCIQQSPNFGATCLVSTKADSPTFFITSKSLSLLEESFINIKLTVKNDLGYTDSADVTLFIKALPIPVLSIASLKSTYNLNEKIILNASIESTRIPVTVTWSCNLFPMNNPVVKSPFKVPFKYHYLVVFFQIIFSSF